MRAPANLALMLELPASELTTLFNPEMRLGYATGIPTEKAVELLCKVIRRQCRLVFDNIGTVFKASGAYTWFEEKHNIKKLTDVQRREAWIEYAIRLVEGKTEKLVIALQSKKIWLEQLHAHLTNARRKFVKRCCSNEEDKKETCREQDRHELLAAKKPSDKRGSLLYCFHRNFFV